MSFGNKWLQGFRQQTTGHYCDIIIIAYSIITAIPTTVIPMAKIGLVEWPNPFAAVTIGYLVSTLLVFTSSTIRERGWPVPFSRDGWLWFSAVGVCNGLAVLSRYQALALGSVALVAPLVACYPLATLALGWIVPGSAAITRQTVFGVGITVVGIAVLLSVSSVRLFM